MQAKAKRRAKKAPGMPALASASADLSLNQEEVARLAHSYWEARGCQGGSAEEDWFRAERELRAIQANEG
jgi:hypothetical protein